MHLVLGFQQQEVWGVHSEELQQVENGQNEVKHCMAEAAHKVIQGVVHSHGGW